MLTILIVQLWPRVSRAIPSPLVALLATTALAHGLGFDVATRFQHGGTRPLLTGTQQQPLAVMKKSGCLRRIGEENLLPSLAEAAARAQELLQQAEGGANSP